VQGPDGQAVEPQQTPPLEHAIDDGPREIFVVGEVGYLTYGTYRFINFHRWLNWLACAFRRSVPALQSCFPIRRSARINRRVSLTDERE